VPVIVWWLDLTDPGPHIYDRFDFDSMVAARANCIKRCPIRQTETDRGSYRCLNHVDIATDVFEADTRPVIHDLVHDQVHHLIVHVAETVVWRWWRRRWRLFGMMLLLSLASWTARADSTIPLLLLMTQSTKQHQLLSNVLSKYVRTPKSDILNKLRCPETFQPLTVSPVKFRKSVLPYCLNNQ